MSVEAVGRGLFCPFVTTDFVGEPYFKGRKIEQAKRVDLYANCFVRRDHATKALKLDRKLEDPPAGLSLRNLNKEEN